MSILYKDFRWREPVCDSQGRPVREDVREAANRIWISCLRHEPGVLSAENVLTPAGGAPKLLRDAAFSVSSELDNAGAPASIEHAKRLVSLLVCRALYKRARNLHLSEFVYNGPAWRDRELDDQGKPIREDVREAAREIWSEYCAQGPEAVQNATEFQRLLKKEAIHVSWYLNEVSPPASEDDARYLLEMCLFDPWWEHPRDTADTAAV